MKNNKYYIALLLIYFLTGCNSDKKKENVLKNEKRVTNLIPFTNNQETSLPSLHTTKEGVLTLSWVKKVNDSITQLNYTQLNHGKWETSKEIIKGKNWFVNWADFPSITSNNDNLLTHFLKKSSKETFSYEIKLNLLAKGKEKWTTNLTLHNDNTKTEHGFVSALPYNTGFFLTWLDGRNTGSNAAKTNNNHAGHSGTMTLRSAEVSPEGIVTNSTLLDTKTCSCCQTTAAITKNGPIVLYRDRTDNEIRDIAITRYINGKWITPQPIYNDQWLIKGCPVNGPKVDAIENNVAVAWYTAVNDKPEVKVIFSEDGGANFLSPTIINSGENLGRVDIELINSETAIVSWIAISEDKTFLKAVKVTKSGKKSNPVIISEISTSRKSGFPQMECIGNKVYFAWTSLKDEIPSIKTAYVALDKF
ncbi:hypothetical protein [Tenacibaculum ovolyticum]|uniref:hypothetical protein n=1 Tax=Tenacibaculum ovolyticum TaxID=104270 RepID=UPI0007EC8326|nr:hypothetical protein [Tenacibaculum ovolyticum]